MKTTRSARLYKLAKTLIPGGVNSPVRAFGSVGTDPLFIRKARGASIWDVDGNRYVDFIGSWGPMILGHAYPPVVKSIRDAAAHSTSFGTSSELEVEMADLITDMVPSVEMVRMVNSGTEATMSAIRVARAFTRREKILKFEGCYHGHADPFLIKAGSGAMTLGVPDSPGVPAAISAGTLNARYNDFSSVRKTLEHHAGTVAAIIVEPVVGNMGCVPPQPGFLRELRELCDEHGCLLIFDEVMTGFRLSPGGAQQLYDVMPDLTTLGKIIGGGLPVGAYGGREDIMKCVAPSGPVYQAGTLSGNPLAMAAGVTVLKELRKKRSVYTHLERLGRRLDAGVVRVMKETGHSFSYNRVGSMFTFFFTAMPVLDYPSANSSDRTMFGRFFRHMLEAGMFLPPSQFEAAFLSRAHTNKEVDKYLKGLRGFLVDL